MQRVLFDEKKRDSRIDIMKGIGIILMVVGHTPCPWNHYIYLFHMPVFFMISGYLFNEQYVESFESARRCMLKRLKSLYVPFVCWNIFFILFNNLFIKLNFITLDPRIAEYGRAGDNAVGVYLSLTLMLKKIAYCFAFKGFSPLLGAFWFIRILFMIECAYLALGFIIYKCFDKSMYLLVQSAAAILFLLAGYYMYTKKVSLLGIDKMLSCYILFHMGVIIKRLSKRIPNDLGNGHAVVVFVLSGMMLFFLNNCGTVELSQNRYEDPLFLIFAAIVGWLFLYSAANSICKIACLREFFGFFGQNTIEIMALHTVGLRIVSMIWVISHSEDRYLIAANSSLHLSGGWWVVYLLMGLMIPFLYVAIRDKVISIKGRNDSDRYESIL